MRNMVQHNVKGMPHEGETFDSHAVYMYAVCELDDPFKHMIINLDNGNVEFWTDDMCEFVEMWEEMKR